MQFCMVMYLSWLYMYKSNNSGHIMTAYRAYEPYDTV